MHMQYYAVLYSTSDKTTPFYISALFDIGYNVYGSKLFSARKYIGTMRIELFVTVEYIV